MIDRDEAIRLALEDLNRDSRGYSFQVVGADAEQDHWSVVVEKRNPAGHPVMGAIVLLVDSTSGKVRSLHQAISEGWRRR